jgi:hypothetical protein
MLSHSKSKVQQQLLRCRAGNRHKQQALQQQLGACVSKLAERHFYALLLHTWPLEYLLQVLLQLLKLMQLLVWQLDLQQRTRQTSC